MSTFQPETTEIKMPQLAASPFEFEPEVLKLGEGYFPTMDEEDAFVDVDLSEDGEWTSAAVLRVDIDSPVACYSRRLQWQV